MGTMVPGTLLILLAASQGQTQTCPVISFPGGLTDTSGVTRKDI
uniref:Histocompatibility 2, T region locus 3 n=1 Tax=Mus musculus TaxID=10090 RepID=S4R2B8_MOUSE